MRLSSGAVCGVLLADRENKYLHSFSYYSSLKKLVSISIPPLSLEKKDSSLSYSLLTGRAITLNAYDFLKCLEQPNIENYAKKKVLLIPVRCNSFFGFLTLSMEQEVDASSVEEELRLLGNHYMCCYTHLKTLDNEVKRNTLLESQLKHFHKKGVASYQRNSKLLKTVLVGSSRPLNDMRNAIQRMANSSYHVLVRGETGSGKELVVQEIYRLSSALSGSLIIQNCAAIPHDLLESELFGYEKGAFTGAEKQKKGLFALADKGMLFLDEIGDLPYELQSKILRVLQDKRFRPLGSTAEVSADFRLITATHQPLEKMIAEGDFRQDLYYRLQQSCISVPPLREHKSDVEELSLHFIRQCEQANGLYNLSLDKAAIDVLRDYNYPGNIRELKNIIRQACLIVVEEKKTVITKKMILNVLGESHINLLDFSEKSQMIKDSHMLEQKIENLSLRDACNEFEAYMIENALIKHQGNRKHAAQQLQTPDRTFSHKCQKHGL